jgi:hypothetical protein
LCSVSARTRLVREELRAQPLRKLHGLPDCCDRGLPVRIAVDIHKPLHAAPKHAGMNAS